MRVKIKFNAEKDIVLPIQYNSILQGFIYNSFSDESFADFLHDRGYKWNKRNFKLFTFSRLMGKYRINKEKKEIIFKPPVDLVISSIKDKIIEDLTANIIKQSWVRLGKQKVFLDEVSFKFFEGKNNLKIKMLSPVVVYSTGEIGGKKKTYYYSPWEGEFEQQIKDNLMKKFELINDKEKEEGEFKIKPLFSKKRNPNIIIYRGFVIKGWMGKFEISGDTQLLKTGYDTGLGAKNSMGFGCFEIN